MPIIDSKGQSLSDKAVNSFLSRVRSEVVFSDDPDYEKFRKVWNGRIDRYPSAIVRCQNCADVAYTIQFAREYDVPLTVRGGGHSIAGSSVADGKLLLDLHSMRGVHVDPAKKVVYSQPGLSAGDLDHETHIYSLACPLGEVSITGISGLTLGGGYGLLSQRYGLTCDNMLGCELVNADGEVLQVNNNENADLYWALRGAGSFFGVVTNFTYQLHPVNNVLLGFFCYSLNDAAAVLKYFRDHLLEDNQGIACRATFVHLPTGDPGLLLRICAPEEIELGKTIVEQAANFGSPIMKEIHVMPFPEVQMMSDANVPSGLFYASRSNFIENFSDEAIRLLIDGFAQSPSNKNAIFLEPGGGAIARVPIEETAFYYRDFMLNLLINSVWEKPEEEEKNVTWTVDLWKEMAPYLGEGVYVNFLEDEGVDRVKAAYGGHYPKLVQLKQKYDPNSMFSPEEYFKP